jgi:septal ring factor EnvC (AmiA/AmiB activator)
MALRGVALFLALGLAHQLVVTDGLSLSANPIRRVVTMLQKMQKKIEAEAKAEEKLYDKFMCWCQTGAGDLQKSISGAETKIPQLESSIKEKEEEIAQLSADLDKAKKDREEANEVVANGKALRAKEAAAFAKESGEMKANLAAMTSAISALEKGMTGGFLQTSGAATIRKLVINMDLSSSDRDVLASFLSQGQGSETGYAPASGEIVGILKEMKDTMTADLKEITEAEEKSKADFEGMMKAKAAQIEALTKEIEEKTERRGNGQVELVNMKEDLDDTQKSLAEDKGFLGNLDKTCETKKAEWTERQKTRAEEQLAILDTIKILNDDDALELFKKTLPSPSLLQDRASSQQLKHRALTLLSGDKHDMRLDLISMALRGRKVNFEKIIKMIDDMVALLGKEQKDDDEKKAYCEASLDKAEDEKKELEHAIDDLSTAIEENQGSIESLTHEIADLTQGIKELDKAVADATETRKEEHAEYVQDLAANNAAKDVIAFAKNRLQKFYNPKLYVAPPKRELTEEQRITQNMGGTLAPTAAPGGIAGTGISALQDAPPPPPETYGAYAKKGQESAGVMAMMDMLVADLDKEIQEMEVEEKNAQAEYEQFMADSAAKRADDSKSISEKEEAKAGLSADLVKMTGERKSKVAEAMAKAQYIKNLHAECDWLVSNFDVRKEARAGEVDSLKKAKAVLSGADYSM